MFEDDAKNEEVFGRMRVVCSCGRKFPDKEDEKLLQTLDNAMTIGGGSGFIAGLIVYHLIDNQSHTVSWSVAHPAVA